MRSHMFTLTMVTIGLILLGFPLWNLLMEINAQIGAAA